MTEPSGKKTGLERAGSWAAFLWIMLLGQLYLRWSFSEEGDTENHETACTFPER